MKYWTIELLTGTHLELGESHRTGQEHTTKYYLYDSLFIITLFFV